MDIRTAEGKIEAYVFEKHVDTAGVHAIKRGLAGAPGVRFVAHFVGAFNLFARVVADDLGELQRLIAGEYFRAGVRSDWSVNLTGMRPNAPKRHSPDVCALVCVRTTLDPFELLETLDRRFDRAGAYGAAVVTAADFDLVVDLGAETIEEVLDRVVELRSVKGVGHTSTALAHLADNAIRVEES